MEAALMTAVKSRIFKTNRGQAVRLPKEAEFPGRLHLEESSSAGQKALPVLSRPDGHFRLLLVIRFAKASQAGQADDYNVSLNFA